MNKSKTKTRNSKNPVVLALYPYGRGMAHAVMDSSTHIVESGLRSIAPLSLSKSLNLVKAYLYYYQPDVVILRSPECVKVKQSVLAIINKIEAYARNLKLNVFLFSREDISASFQTYDASTRYEINKVITLCFPEYTQKRPKRRKLGHPEPYGIAEFDAISLALTYFILKS